MSMKRVGVVILFDSLFLVKPAEPNEFFRTIWGVVVG